MSSKQRLNKLEATLCAETEGDHVFLIVLTSEQALFNYDSL